MSREATAWPRREPGIMNNAQLSVDDDAAIATPPSVIDRARIRSARFASEIASANVERCEKRDVAKYAETNQMRESKPGDQKE